MRYLLYVINQSGSMVGEKNNLVKLSFNFLLDLLNENDRV